MNFLLILSKTFIYLTNISHIINVGGIKMVSITLAVPPELKAEMDKHPEFNWSEIARKAIRERLEFLKKMDAMFANSKLTEEDAIELGRKVNKAVAKKYRKLL